ncbi:hypothetical protein LTR09_006923 [Extremus antarcticus]|uniref:Aminoglycoside phosphotransferase domain-containing protein n=1 Tax=Extremus antarcticus TaxID=702011 RepID=A0AAJ0DDG4_9PEZI|nr:hypothetical protein LTR09_006923 [Extremus antarcticus]
MALEVPQRTATPPDHPAYGINLTDEAIENIIAKCIPDLAGPLTVEKLHHDKSWNNRIYFISGEPSAPRYVLKLAGRPFVPAKIENEVACLSLLGRFCPNVPTPRVIAWTTDGRSIYRSRPNDDVSAARPTIMIEGPAYGWILMTRLPGEALEPSELASGDRQEIARELAAIILTWRGSIPPSTHCGNLHIRSAARVEESTQVADEPMQAHSTYDVHGILEIDSQYSEPLTSTLGFWKHRLSWALDTLATSRVYAPNREEERVVRLQLFIDSVLPDLLPPFPETGEILPVESFVFTHTDLSPRNILVSGRPPRMTGIVDFEYSGFFPILQEFMGKSVVSLEEDDEGWPVDMHSAILQGFEDHLANGTMTGRACDDREWKLTRTLMEMETHIAPWWLSEHTPDGELESELLKARGTVDRCLSSLEAGLK